MTGYTEWLLSKEEAVITQYSNLIQVQNTMIEDLKIANEELIKSEEELIEELAKELEQQRLYQQQLEEQTSKNLSVEIQEPQLVSLGTFELTAYCSCYYCCGNSVGTTFTGTVPQANRTIGVDPNVIPLGSEVYINGQKYIAEDTGNAVIGNVIDVYMDNHNDALAFGRQIHEVFIYV